MTDKPLLYDLFSGSGGASMGYSRAGFRVIGIDNDPKPLRHYPFESICMDALEFLDRYNAGEFERASAFHASPPCQAFTKAISPLVGYRKEHPNLIAPTRIRLSKTQMPYVIENVPGAPLTNYIVLDGTMFGLRTKKERLFELHNFVIPLLSVNMPLQTRGMVKRGLLVGIVQHNIYPKEVHSGRTELAEAYDIHWGLNRHELRQAIPPTYTEFIGKYLMQAITQPPLILTEKE